MSPPASLRRRLRLTSTWLWLAALAACAPSSSIPARGPAAPLPSADGAAVVADTVLIGTVTVGGRATAVLTNGRGHTLYYRTKDRPPRGVCSYGCAVSWPPLLVRQGVPRAPGPLPGTLATVTNDNGEQVTYNGHPLYSFSDDTGPGLARGQGGGGIWFVATLELHPA